MALLIFSLLVTVIFSLSGESSLVSFNKERMQLWPGNEPFLTGRPYSLIWCLLLGNKIVKQSKMVNEELVGKQETLMDQSVLAGPFATGLISSIFWDVIEIPGDGGTSASKCPVSSLLVFLLSHSGSRARVRRAVKPQGTRRRNPKRKK